jgi:hypothetical protein
MAKRKEWLKRLLATALGSLFALALGEGVLRQLVPVDRGASWEFRVPHPILGWVLEPGRRYRYRLPEHTISVEHNSRGWRDIEHGEDNPRGAFRLAVLGDSFMEAYSVELEDATPRRLERAFSERGIPSEVINLGVGGYGTLQQYLAFRDVGRRYAPDLVLLAFTVSNDVTNNSLTLERLAARNPDHVDSRPFLSPDREGFDISLVNYEAARARYERSQRWRHSLRYRVRERSVLLQLLDGAYTKVSHALAGDALDSARERPARSGRDLGFLGVHFCDEPPEVREAWDVTARIVARLKVEVEEAGSDLVVFSVPSIHETVPEYIDGTTEAAEDPGLVCLNDAPGYQRLATMLAEMDLEYIDLLPVFRNAVRVEGEVLFLESDLHWNAAGHALATEILLRRLIGSRLPHVRERP